MHAETLVRIGKRDKKGREKKYPKAIIAKFPETKTYALVISGVAGTGLTREDLTELHKDLGEALANDEP